MIYFVLQSALLLLAVYLIGAALGCMLRSLFQDSEDAAAVRATGVATDDATSGAQTSPAKR